MTSDSVERVPLLFMARMNGVWHLNFHLFVRSESAAVFVTSVPLQNKGHVSNHVSCYFSGSSQLTGIVLWMRGSQGGRR
jgi:hypothetical protein